MSVSIDYNNLPNHIAIIMDGNGRWAKRRMLGREAGHKAGAQNLRKLCEKMNAAGFKQLTVYAFSTENWKRSDEEVTALMNLLREYIQQYIDDSKKNNMRICTIGDLSRLDDDLRERIAYLKELTKQNEGLCLNIAINYGGRDEITRAVRKIAADGVTADKIDEKLVASYLDTAELDFPDPELLIRTSGEIRLSNFLLWQISYSEIFVTNKLWPDFSYNDLLKAVADFQSRKRNFGGR